VGNFGGPGATHGGKRGGPDGFSGIPQEFGTQIEQVRGRSEQPGPGMPVLVHGLDIKARCVGAVDGVRVGLRTEREAVSPGVGRQGQKLVFKGSPGSPLGHRRCTFEGDVAVLDK
jgi:hypothetical protein